MSLKHVKETSVKWFDECNAHIDGAQLDASRRNLTSAALLHLSLEHHAAINLLMSNEMHPYYGSAFALLRPQFESCVRGVWFHRCASEQEIINFTKNEKSEPPKISKLIEEIDKSCGIDEKLLSLKTWRILCGYTHGGSIQVASRNSTSEIASNYTEKQVRGLISYSCLITLRASLAFAKLLDNEIMANTLWAGYELLFMQKA